MSTMCPVPPPRSGRHTGLEDDIHDALIGKGFGVTIDRRKRWNVMRSKGGGWWRARLEVKGEKRAEKKEKKGRLF